MRPGKGCASCRERHLKCLTEPGNKKCTRCSEAGRECTFGPKYRFRQVSHLDGTSQADRSRQELSYARDQKWVSTRKHCLYHPTWSEIETDCKQIASLSKMGLVWSMAYPTMKSPWSRRQNLTLQRLRQKSRDVALPFRACYHRQCLQKCGTIMV